jgi:hypothetical protein
MDQTLRGDSKLDDHPCLSEHEISRLLEIGAAILDRLLRLVHTFDIARKRKENFSE